MLERTIRCGLINLSEQTAAIREFQTDSLHPGVFLKNQILPLLADEKSALILHTGILTGTGAPGTGMMTWYALSEGEERRCFAEGKMGAFLRYAGFDTLVITGKSQEMATVAVRDGEIAVEPSSDNIEALEAKYEDEFGTLAYAFENGVTEDQDYLIGDQLIAGQFRERNLAAISVMGTGYLEPADGEGFVASAAELWSACKKPVDSGRHALHRVRYFSAGDVPAEEGTERYEKNLQNQEQLTAALLGMYWPNAIPKERMEEQMTKLLRCVTGNSLSWTQLCLEGQQIEKEKGGQRV